MKIMRNRRGWIPVILCLALIAGVGQVSAVTTTYTSTDIPQIITTDSPPATSVITVPCAGRIVDVNVQLDIIHTFDANLVITLIAPHGQSILLSNQNGGDGDNYSGTVFDDEAAFPIAAGAAPFAGSYRPELPLFFLQGWSAEGTWTLQIADTVNWADHGLLKSWSLTIETVFGSYTSMDVGQAIITANPPVTSVLTVPCGGKIVDLNVMLSITHTSDQDLDIFLIAPNGTRIELSTDNGGTGDDYLSTVFDDEAATPITADSAPFAGSYRPESPLSVLNGSDAAGTWTLEIGDDVFLSDFGTLHGWSLAFTSVTSGYSLSSYASGLPAAPAGLTADQRTRTLYYADIGCDGVLRKIAPDGTVSTVTTDFTPNGTGCLGYFYPYRHTDIQFLNGSVYVLLAGDFTSDGELVQINTATGITTTEYSFPGFGTESGIAAWQGKLLVTSGAGIATEIQSYVPATDTADAVLDVSPLTNVYNVEYDPTHDTAYFWSDNVFYKADFGAGTYTAIPGYTATYADFAVSPDGNFLFTANHPHIDVVTIADGSPRTVYNGLTNPTRHDMVLAPSSSGGGCSLYVADGTSILEISGLRGRCQPFPWTMFLPAMNHK